MSPSSMADLKQIFGRNAKRDLGIDSFVAEITPGMAVALLQHNANIRKLRESVVTQYVTDMMLDGWTVTGEPLIFDRNGVLKNGQHRLTACTRADRPFTTCVTVGVDPEVDLNMDRPTIRKFGDYLGNHGFNDSKNLAAAIRLSYQLVKNGKVEQSPILTHELLIRWFRDGHESVAEDLAVARQWERRWPKGFTRNHGAAIRHASSFVPGVEVDDVDAFFKSLAYDMETVDTRSAPHVLHRTFERMVAASKSGRIQIPMRMAVTIKALNAYLAGEDVTPQSISWRRGGRNPEAFPTIGLEVVAAEGEDVSA